MSAAVCAPSALEARQDDGGVLWLRVGTATEPGAPELIHLVTSAVDYAADPYDPARADALGRAVEAYRLAGLVALT